LLWKKYDAVLIFGWNSLTNWLAFGVAVLSGSKVLMRGESPLNQESSRPYWKLAIKRMVLKRLFKRISAFLCIGEENRKFYEHYGAAKEKLFFAPYAVDNNFFMSEAARLFPKKSELRKLLGLKGNKFIFLFVGKFIDKKRPMDLIRAYELVKDPKKALVMVGDGILKEEAAKYVREQGIENVIFAGFKNQTELPEYYALADALVLPSGSGETWGLVVNEAMCFGLSVIVSDVVGCGPDLVKQDENGFVFHLGNIKELSHCLEELAADPEKKERFGKRSIEIIRDFSFDKDADAIASSLGPIK